jgi:hypothetical protein
MTGRKQTLLDQEMVVAKLNRMMIGWANYFCLGPVSKAYRAVDRHARKRLRPWLCAKHQVSWPATKKFPDAALYKRAGSRLSTQADAQPSVGRLPSEASSALRKSSKYSCASNAVLFLQYTTPSFNTAKPLTKEVLSLRVPCFRKCTIGSNGSRAAEQIRRKTTRF